MEEGRALRAAAAAALGFALPDEEGGELFEDALQSLQPLQTEPEREPEAPAPPAPAPAPAAASRAPAEAPPAAQAAPPVAAVDDGAVDALVARFEAAMTAMAPRTRRGDAASASAFASMLAASARTSLGEGRGRGARFALSFAADTLQQRGDAAGAALLRCLLALLEGAPADAAADAQLPPPLRQQLEDVRARAALSGWPPQQGGALFPAAAEARREALQTALLICCQRAEDLPKE